MLTVTVEHDPTGQRFYAVLPDGSEAELRYQTAGRILTFHHTYVPEAYRTQGIAEQVVSAGFDYARRAGFRVIPACPYVSGAFLKRHPEFSDLVASR